MTAPVDWDNMHMDQTLASSESLNYNHLFQLIKPIIPLAYRNKTSHSDDDPNYEIVRGVLETTRDIFNKIDDPKRKADLRKIFNEGRDLLIPSKTINGFRSSAQYHIKDEDRDALLKEFTEALKTSEEESNLMAKAPFSKLGEDDFEDVDHQILAMEIKKLALTLKKYLQTLPTIDYNRITNKDFTENKNKEIEYLLRSKYFTDSLLTQMTLELAKLHRAVLRNQHHILMILGNFAGNTANVAPRKEDNDTKNIEESDI